MAVITISRQFGSGAEEIAARVCHLLGYRYFDKEMIAQVINQVALSEKEVVDFSEEHYQAAGFLERLLRPGPYIVAQVPVLSYDESGAEIESVKQLDEPRFLKLIHTVIHAAYNRGNVVIMGRGGQALLQDLPGVLHVRIEAPMRTRLLRIRERTGLAVEEAQQEALRRDRTAAQYLNKLFAVRWDNPLLYHLVLNTGRWDTEAAAQIIVQAGGQLERGLVAAQPVGEASAV